MLRAPELLLLSISLYMNTISTDTSPDECVSTENARDRLKNRLLSVLADGENTLIEAPTSLGKTHHIATRPWREHSEITGGEPVVHLHCTTDARKQAADMSEDAGIDYTVLKGREELCPVANGEHDDELTAPDGSKPSVFFKRECDEQSYAFSEVHNHLERELGELPCQRDGKCGGAGQWNSVPRNEDGEPGYDVIHATHHFARVPTLIENANVVIDERPDYTEDIGQEDLKRAIDSLLERLAPERRLTRPKLIAAIAYEDERTLAKYRDLLDGTSDEPEPLTNRDTHKHTKSILRALVSAEPEVENRFTGKDGRTTVVVKDNGDMPVIRRQPAFSEARCVIGLDAHPCKRLWERNIGTDPHQREVLEKQERREWRRNERGLSVIQIGNNTRPFTTRTWWSDNPRGKVKAIIRTLHDVYGDAFRTCITTSAIEDDIKRFMQEENIENAETMHYGEQNSRNDFKNESIGLLIGCNGPSDEWILDMLAEQGLEARPERYEDGDRAHGREFIGPDADAAQEFLESVREENVAQAIGRYARNAEDSKDVTVYAWTNAILEYMVDGKAPGVTSEITNTKRTMLHVLDEQGPVTTREVAEEAGCTKPHVASVFKNMVEQGILSVSKKTGKYGAHEYDTTGTDKNLSPMVDLEPGPIANSGSQGASF